MAKARILVVDDSELLLEAFNLELEIYGYEVETANCGKKALEHIQKKEFDIVFTDLVMPEMDGLTLCKKIKEISPEVEVVLVTGHPSKVEEIKQEFWKAGGRKEIIQKPLMDETISKIAERILKEIQNSHE